MTHNIYTSRAYALYRLGNRLHYIQTCRPDLYEAVAEDGTLQATFFDPHLIPGYTARGLTVRKADIDAEIRRLQARIAHYQGLPR
jgi:hypothetical protein